MVIISGVPIFRIFTVCTYSGEANLPLSFMYPFSVGSTLQRKNLLHLELIFPLRLHPILERLSLPGKQIRNLKSCFPWNNMEVDLYNLKFFGIFGVGKQEFLEWANRNSKKYLFYSVKFTK